MEGLQSLRGVAVTLDWEGRPDVSLLQAAADACYGNAGGDLRSGSGNLLDEVLEPRGAEVEGGSTGNGGRDFRLVVRAACPLKKGTVLSHGLHVIGAPADVVLLSEGPEALGPEPSGQHGELPALAFPVQLGNCTQCTHHANLSLFEFNTP